MLVRWRGTNDKKTVCELHEYLYELYEYLYGPSIAKSSVFMWTSLAYIFRVVISW